VPRQCIMVVKLQNPNVSRALTSIEHTFCVGCHLFNWKERDYMKIQ